MVHTQSWRFQSLIQGINRNRDHAKAALYFGSGFAVYESAEIGMLSLSGTNLNWQWEVSAGYFIAFPL